MLKRGGFEVKYERVATAAEMEAALRRQSWDAVVSDYNIPGFGGLDALGILRATGQDIPFILISESLGEEIAVDALKAGVGDYVLKGNLSRLPSVLERELREAGARAAHRQMQRDLVESEDRFRDLVENSFDLICTHDLDGRLLTVNESAVRLTGYPRDALLHMNMAELLPLESRHLFTAYLAEIRAKGLASGVLRVQTASGEIRWWEYRNSLRMDGVVAGRVRGMAHDVTDRMRAEEALRETESRFRQLAENIREVFWLTDPSKNEMLYISPAYEEIWGRSVDNLYSSPRDWLEAIHAEDRDRVLEAAQMKQARGDYDEEYRIERPDGSIRWIRDRAFPVLGRDGKVIRVAGVAEDITERKLQQRRIERLSRVHAVMSGINALIVRTRSADELFREACRIAVDAGRFRLAWIGVVNRESRRVEPVAWVGAEEDYIRSMPVGLDTGSVEGVGLAGFSVRERKAIVSDDMSKDARILLKAESLERGFRSMVTLPLIVGDEVVAVLALYAAETGFFDDDELKLLSELASDIAFALEHIEKSERVNYLAYYDQLTGLANRSLFVERVKNAIHNAGQQGSKLAIAEFDIERLSIVNSSLGRHAGDALLKQVAERLALAAGADNVARTSASNFAMMLPTAKGRHETARMVEAISRKCFAEPFQVSGTELRVAAKGGMAQFPDDGNDAETLVRNAEVALRKGKQTGERHTFYTQGLTERTSTTLTLENKLRQALEKEEFVLHYQPKVDFESRRIVGVEALIRWQSPELGLVPPGKFIPLMEETGIILEAGAWALSKAASDQSRWKEFGLSAPRVAVNVSAIQLRKTDFFDTLADAVGRGTNPPGVDIEITESLVMEDIEGNIGKLKRVRELGMEIAIDDFGTGYSSLGYLAKLPVHTLKIDRSFIITMLNDPDTMALVQTIISLAHSLKLKVVAEGVDEEEQAKLLKLLRCDQMQGYLFSKPLPFDDMTALLKRA